MFVNTMDRTTAKWLGELFRPFRWGIFQVALLVALSAVGPLLTPWPLTFLVDNVLGNQPWPRWLAPVVGPIEGRTFLLVALVAGAALGVRVLASALSTISSYYEVDLNQRLVLDVRRRLFEHLQRLSLAYHERRGVGETVYSLGTDVYAPASFLTAGLLPLATSFITLALMFVILYRLSPSISLVALLVVPFLLICIRYHVRFLSAHSERVRQREADIYTVIHQAFSSIKLIVAFAREAEEERRFSGASETAYHERMGLTRREMVFSVTLEAVFAAGMSAILLVGGYNVLHGGMTVGEILVVLSYLGAVYQPLHVISSTLGGLQDGLVGIRRVRAVLEQHLDVYDRPGAKPLPAPPGPLRFEHVGFAYAPDHAVLHDVSFEVRPGETLALVGHTGAGKSTVLSLILRFYDPQSGAVRLGGRDLRDVTLKSLRGAISLVSQDTLLVPGTIADNIRYGRLGATMDEVERAARLARADDFIRGLPDGYDTVLGEAGAGLSGGQRQRLAIARAFLKDAPILLLDEPTSALDVTTEREVVASWRDLMQDRTTIIVAHRLTTVAQADRVLVFQDGRIVEEGAPASLLASGGIFAGWHNDGQAAPAG
jgi:ATP-binding cassette subfamily B protein/subfamily B ATP-binding cassette protein MsbA